MRKIILALTFLLGALGGIVNAQSFDFDCAEPEPEPNPNVIEFIDFAYDSENNILTFRGDIVYNRNGGDFNAPDGLVNADRYAGVGLRRGGDGRWRIFYQNNGDCSTNGCISKFKVNGSNSYMPGHHLAFDWTSFERAVGAIYAVNSRSLIPNRVFFADRNGPSVNHRRLNQWTGHSGWTRQPINGVSYPGIIRFTKNGNNWDVWLEPNDKTLPSKRIRTNSNAGKVEQDLSSIAGAYLWHYENPEN